MCYNRKIYLASSWKNPMQEQYVAMLIDEGHEVYDFKETGFHWSDLDTEYDKWTPVEFRRGLSDYRSIEHFELDKDAMDWADTCVLLLPCGRSAHLEAGYMAGEGKNVVALLDPGEVIPELMYSLLSDICVTKDELLKYLSHGLVNV